MPKTKPDYMLDCPNCGATLTFHIGAPDHAPWICRKCSRGWWASELTAQARRAWRTVEQDHLGADNDTYLNIDLARWVERDVAMKRGTSVTPEMLAMLTLAQLQAAATALTARVNTLPRAQALLDLVNLAISQK